MDDAKSIGLNSRYCCGAIEIDATQRQVLIDRTPARLGARAFDVLLALVERRERIVPKRELMDLVWPRVVVEENNLLVHMVALRKLLGPQAIVTIPGRGYRFAMRVDTVFRSGPAEIAPSDSAPSSTSASAATHGNLPDSPTLFGREQDLDAVEDMLREHAVVTIVGAGGIGKTRMAMVAAMATRLETPNGRWWVDLAPVNDGAQVPHSVAAVLGMQLPPSRQLPAVLAAALAGQRLLLVLDSCEHLLEDIASLVDLLRSRAPHVRLLVTSQESLKCRDEQVYRLGGLAVPASVQLEEAAQFGAVTLFIERARALDPRFRLADDNVEMVIDVCRRLDGIPLAIELAAARVPLLGVHGLQARLNQMFNVLTGGTRMKLRRHQTLRAALEWSYGLLSAEEQSVFRRLGVFAGGFSMELAQTVVCDKRVDQWLALDLLGHLVDKSLVVVDGEAEPRYRLLETARAFALEKLAEASESEAMLRRHAQAICELMTANAKYWNLAPARRRHAVLELSNLRAAIDWTMISVGNRTLAYELLGNCWFVWMLSGLTVEGGQRMLNLWPSPRDLPTKVEADFCRGFARLNKNAASEEHWQAARRAEALYRQLGDVDGLGHALLLVASIGAVSDRLPEAEQALREAEQLVTDASRQGPLAGTQGEFHLRRGAPDLAMKAFRRQLEVYRGAGEVLGEHIALGNLGCAQLDAGDLDAAIASLCSSVEGLRSFHTPHGLEFRLGTLAVALAWRGDDMDILPLAREAFDHLRLLGVTFAPLMAAALQHGRHYDPQRAVVLTAYAYSRLPREKHTRRIDLPMRQRILDRAAATRPSATIESWLRTGERLSEDQAAAIAFDRAPLEALP